MDLAQLTALLAAIGVSGIVGAFVQAFVNRRKLGAEATQILTSAAGGLVERLDAEAKGLRDQVGKLQDKLNLLEEAQRLSDRRERATEMVQERWRWHMDRWHRYSARLAETIRELGGTIEDPPPMWPEPVTLEDVDLSQ